MKVQKNLQDNYIVNDNGEMSVIPAWDVENHAKMTKFLLDNPECVEAYVPTDLDYQVLRSNITARLAEIDREAIRPMRAALAGTSTLFDTDKLAELEAEADKLREELRGLLDG